LFIHDKKKKFKFENAYKYEKFTKILPDGFTPGKKLDNYGTKRINLFSYIIIILHEKKENNLDQCGGSGMFNPDPDFYPPRIPDPGSRISDPGSKNSNKREG
jgi:hypothetical protein